VSSATRRMKDLTEPSMQDKARCIIVGLPVESLQKSATFGPGILKTPGKSRKYLGPFAGLRSHRSSLCNISATTYHRSHPSMERILA